MESGTLYLTVYDVRQHGKFLGSFGSYSLKNRISQGHLDPEVEIALKGSGAWRPAWEVIPEVAAILHQKRVLATPAPERTILSAEESFWDKFKHRAVAGAVMLVGPVASMAVLAGLISGVIFLVGILSEPKGSPQAALEAALKADTKGLYQQLNGSLFSRKVDVEEAVIEGGPQLLLAYLGKAGSAANADVVKVMLEGGCRAEADWQGRSAASYAVEQIPRDMGAMMLVFLEHGVDADTETGTSTALIEAVKISPKDNGKLMEKLLMAGADAERAPSGDKKQTPLAAAWRIFPNDQGKALRRLWAGGGRLSAEFEHREMTRAFLREKAAGSLLQEAVKAGLVVPEDFWESVDSPETATALAGLFPQEAEQRGLVKPEAALP